MDIFNLCGLSVIYHNNSSLAKVYENGHISHVITGLGFALVAQNSHKVAAFIGHYALLIE